MHILAFDTCLGACSVAIGLDAGQALEKVETLYEEMATGQAERLMPMIDEAMRTAGIGFAELSRIAVTTGPGTFTGTRIGVAAARALALVTGASLVGISTLTLMAEAALQAVGSARHERPIVVTVDAHRGQVYTQRVDPAAAGAAQPQLLTIAQAAAFSADRETLFVGSGAAAVACAAADLGYIAECALPQLQPNAAYLLLLAQSASAHEGPLRPLYLRPADAKPQTNKSLLRVSP